MLVDVSHHKLSISYVVNNALFYLDTYHIVFRNDEISCYFNIMNKDTIAERLQYFYIMNMTQAIGLRFMFPIKR